MQFTRQEISDLLNQIHHFRQQYGLEHTLDENQQKQLDTLFSTFLAELKKEKEIYVQAKTLAEQALKWNIPYALLTGELNTLKQAIADAIKQHDHSEQPLEAYDRLNLLFTQLLNEIGRQYLHHKARENNLMPALANPKKQYLLQIYEHWFRTLRHALLEDDLKAFEHLAHNNVRFLEALKYPETLMICLDNSACSEVEDAHKNIMRQAALLYSKLVAKRYEQAYLLYSDLSASVKQLSALLTNLYFNYETNRLALFFEFLESISYQRKRLYLTLVNLRHLNRINQLEGEHAGDQLLNQIAHQLEQVIQKHHQHMVFTQGVMGDFYLVSVGLSADKQRPILEDLQTMLKEATPAEVSIQTVCLNQLDQVDRHTVRQLIRYLHQDANQDMMRFLDEKEDLMPVNEWIKKQLALKLNLHQMLEEKKLDIYIQPLYDTRTLKVAAFEALGRLIAGEEVISAGLFIDRLIELRLIEQFDLLILEAIEKHAEALEKLKTPLFINCSPASLKSPRYRERLKALITRQQHRLEIVVELTEQTLMHDINEVIAFAKDTGVQFAIDDFGTGFSSMKTVVELAEAGVARFLKIDGSLTRMINKSAAIQKLFAVIHTLSEVLSMQCVAEFIEDDETLTFLRKAGIEFGQGFFLGKPEPVDTWVIRSLYQV